MRGYGTLISLINVELGINVEGAQKLPNHKTWRVGIFGKSNYYYITLIDEAWRVEKI